MRTTVELSDRPLKRVKRTSVAESAYAAIRDSVLSGRYTPGEQLVEARLAAELGTHAFVEVPHWDGDRIATASAIPRNRAPSCT